MSGSEGLSALRRYRISCQACGHQWKVRGHRVYPNEMSCLRGQRTEKLDSAEYRGLTARPVVLAKTYEPGFVMVFRPKMTPGLDVPTLFSGHLTERTLNFTDRYTVPVLLRGRRLADEATSTRLRPAAFARYRALSAA